MGTCSSVISACAKGQRWADVLVLLSLMEEISIAPNYITFNAALHAFARGERWLEALALWQQIGEVSVDPDIVSFSAMMEVCVKCHQWELAGDFLRRMRAVRLAPDAALYDLLLADFNMVAGAAQEGSRLLVDAAVLLSELLEDRVQPDLMLFNAAIAASGSKSQWAQAVCLVQSMHSSEVKPKALSYSPLLDAL